jgi:hypothetical protein
MALKRLLQCWAQWITLVILAPGEAEIGRTAVRSQPGQKFSRNPSQPIKAGRGSMHMSSKVPEKHK